MKKAIIGTLLFSSFFGYTQEKNTADYNKWSVELNAGQNKALQPFTPNYYQSGNTNYYNFSTVNSFNLGVRKMFNPKFGAKLNVAYNSFSNAPGTSSLPFETKALRASLEGVLNLGRVLEFESFSNRLGVLAHGGIQVSNFSPGKNITFFQRGTGAEDNGGLILGITPQFRILSWLAFNADISYVFNVRQHYTWDGQFNSLDAVNTANSRFNLSGSMVETTVGFTFYLGKKQKHADWYTEKDVAIVPVEKYDDQELKKRINDLEQKNVDIDKDGVPDYLDLQNDTLLGLKVDSKGRFIDENNNGIPDEKEGGSFVDNKTNSQINDPEYNAIVEFEYNIMYYNLSRVDPNKESRKKLVFIIDYLQKHPEYKVILNGYTDMLGTVQSNNVLSNKRVAKLKNILESFNINGDRITIDGKGIDTTYSASNNGEPLARRVNIVIVKQ